MFVCQNLSPLFVHPTYQDVFMVLAKTEGCLEPLEARLVPTLVSILDAPVSCVSDNGHKDNGLVNGSTVSSGLKAVALDVLQTVVRSSLVVKGCPNCLSEVMMTRAFPTALNATTNTDDNSVMQASARLTLLLLK